MIAARVIPWAFLGLSTYLLLTFVVGRGLAGWDAPGAVLGLATAFVAIVWASIVAAALSTIETPSIRAAVAPVLRIRGLAVLGATSIAAFGMILYALRS